MPPRFSSDEDLIHNVLSEESGQSSFACSHCRRQKVKCDRVLPQCSNCSKASRTCTYPLTVQKPGPKAGSHRRPRPTDATAWRHSTQLDSEGHVTKQQRTGETHPKLLSGAKEDTTSRASFDHSDPKNGSVRRTSVSNSGTSQSPRNKNKDGRFLRMMVPTHEPEGNAMLNNESPRDEEGVFARRFEQSCRKLGCSPQQGKALIQVYFSHMASNSLFHRPTFEQKLRGINSSHQLQALLSAMFAFALRYKAGTAILDETAFSSQNMLEISTQLQHACIEECEDEIPPLHLVQSLFLVTYQKSVHGVRGKTWRMVGDCIRMAYELRLNMIDAKSLISETDMNHATESQGRILDEEKRRLWWSIWEMDIFTSTIRRLPNAIDERLNFTYLPVSNEDWYAGREGPSCFLVWEATQRWRKIAESGNKSPQTWFILINSYMYDAHRMVAFPEQWAPKVGFNVTDEAYGRLVPKMRDLLDNCLRCAHMALPPELNWENGFLAFKAGDEFATSRALDTARYGIHVMAQLARLMLYVWEVHNIAAMDPETLDELTTIRSPKPPTDAPPHNTEDEVRSETQIWGRYADAANSMADLIRNSSSSHYQYVDPLISNAIWYAAAAMVVVKLFGPEKFNSSLAASNFDLLVATLSRYEEFWGTPSILKHWLKNLEDKFAQLKREPAEKSVEQSPNPVTNDRQASPVEIALATPLLTAQYPYDQLDNSMIGNGQMDAVYTDFSQPDWTQTFNFGDIPAFGPGQPDLLHANLFDVPFTDNTGLASNDGVNFTDLFMYPYQ